MQMLFLVLKKRILNVFVLFLFIPGMLLAQETKSITGTVTDSNGNAVPSASVNVKGAKKEMYWLFLLFLL